MGSTLTNTQPKDTYKSLLKTSDSTELSATAKYVSDGNGNDSALALSTSAVGIGTSSPASPLSVGNAAAYNSPASTANISTNDTGKYQLRLTSSNFNADGNWVGLGMGYSEDYMKLGIIARASDGSGRGTLNFCVNNSANSSNASLAQTRVSVTENGLTFNGDTAAANALDDYEEGTWTPVLRGSGTAGTYETTILFGSYIKIGNKVVLSTRITLDSTITGGGTGYAQVIGLPFTKSSNQQAIGATGMTNVTFGASTVQVATQFTSSVNSSSVLYFPQTISGSAYLDTPISAFTGGQTIEFSITYFV